MGRRQDADELPPRRQPVDVMVGLTDSQPNQPEQLDEHYELRRRIVEALVNGQGGYTDTMYKVEVALRANGKQVYAHFEDAWGRHTVLFDDLGLPQMRRAALAFGIDLDEVRLDLAA